MQGIFHKYPYSKLFIFPINAHFFHCFLATRSHALHLYLLQFSNLEFQNLHLDHHFLHSYTQKIMKFTPLNKVDLAINGIIK